MPCWGIGGATNTRRWDGVDLGLGVLMSAVTSVEAFYKSYLWKGGKGQRMHCEHTKRKLC